MAKTIFRSEINEWSADGLIRAFDSAPSRSAFDLYLHTPGGDVYAGGEVINSLIAALSRGVKVSIECGSLVASMGASMVAAAKARGCKVSVHPNTEMMFHGCWGMVVGGADELTDEAKAMYDFNGTVKDDLARIGITDTDEWFAADRQKWLNARELLELGIADEIIDYVAKDDDDECKALANRLAARLNHFAKEDKMDEQKPATEVADGSVETKEEPAEPAVAPVAEPVETAPETPANTVETPAPMTETEEFKTAVKDAAETRFRGLQAAHEKKISDLMSQVAKGAMDLAEAKAEVTSLSARCESLTNDLTAMRDQLSAKESELNKANEQLRNHVGSALTPATEVKPVKNARAVMASLPMSERAAFYQAHKAEVDGNL